MPVKPADGCELLRGWKAIGRYLGVSVRTAQRWEDWRALPILRRPQVMAIKTELDIWADGQGGQMEPH